MTRLGSLDRRFLHDCQPHPPSLVSVRISQTAVCGTRSSARVPLHAVGLAADAIYQMHEQCSDAPTCGTARGYVDLDPQRKPAQIFVLGGGAARRRRLLQGRGLLRGACQGVMDADLLRTGS